MFPVDQKYIQTYTDLLSLKAQHAFTRKSDYVRIINVKHYIYEDKKIVLSHKLNKHFSSQSHFSQFKKQNIYTRQKVLNGKSCQTNVVFLTFVGIWQRTLVRVWDMDCAATVGGVLIN